MLGHLALGAEIINARAGGLPTERRLALLHCVLSHHGPEAAGRARGGGSGFASAEALALARINALDASIKGALEHGLR
jgi:3'-5' exoribonuclease